MQVALELLRKIYLSKLSGAKPKKFKKGSGKIIRAILQQAEKAGFLKKSEGKKKGREITKKGLNFLNSISEKIIREKKGK